MAPPDPKQKNKVVPPAKTALLAAKKKNLALAKTALRIASTKTKAGTSRWVGFAFSPGKTKADHILKIDARKKGTALMKEIQAIAKDRKELCCGVATVTKTAGKQILWIKYIRKLGGAERKMVEALLEMKMRYLVKQRKAKDDKADENAQEAEDKRIEDELEDELDTTAEELENSVGQDDDLDELENSSNEQDDDEEDEEEESEEEDEEMTNRDSGEEDDEEEDDNDDDAGEDEEDEQEEEEEEEPAVAADGPKASVKLNALRAGPQVWQGTHRVMSSNLDKLKQAVRKEYSGENPELVAEIEKNIGKIDRILEKLDHRIAESMERAHKAKDEAGRRAELAKAKGLLKEHIAYVASEPLIAHIDSNPFGVETNLKTLLTKSLAHLAKVVS